MSIALNSTDPPAEAAFKLLTRLGVAVLFVALPCIGIFWRNALYVLLPIGAALILIGTLLDETHKSSGKFREALFSVVGVAALFLFFWAALSLLWTPFPREATPRLLKSGATTFLAALVALYLPAISRPLDLFFLPVGLALSGTATLILVYMGSPWFLNGFAFEDTLFERAMVTMIVLIWPALGNLSLRESWLSAAGLAVLAAGVALAGFAQIALLATGAGALTFALAMSYPARTGHFLAWLAGGLFLFAPALPFLYRMALYLTGLEPGPASAPLLIWSDLIVAQWPRLITGHGFDFVRQGLSLGYLPERAPKSLLFVVWYDLGLAGAVSLTALIVQAFRYAGRSPAKTAPALLAGLVANLTIAILGIAAAQIWWVALLNCDIIAFALLFKGLDKVHRPGAQEVRPSETDPVS
ncbi:MAG: hypothetical protein FWD08_00810 [Alphaproteobacteria bacterium]|nr:hypothetical protein [Alphaproteobacteria bacterium]